MKVFSGNATLALAKRIAEHLSLPLGSANVGRFSDGETAVEILENVRGHDVFLIQSTCAPCNDHLMEIMVMADALRRASVASITAVVPYFGYARQDRRVRSARVPITAKVVADMLAGVGVSRLVTVDLHAEQIQGFFHMPVDNVYASPIVLDHMQAHAPNKEDVVIVSPDVGGVMRARAVAKRLNDADLCIVDKRRPSRNQSEVMHVIGHVADRHCVLVDDMVDTAGTLSQAANALKQQGAKTVTAYCTHPVLSGKAVENIMASSLDKLFVMDAIPLQEAAQQCPKITVLSLSRLLAEAIHRVNQKESVSSMF